ncbi:MAG: hypothetical protein RIQ41_150 [Candidatus Parcubacteria bacterium]|jgi:poly(A) polymerase Pap1
MKTTKTLIASLLFVFTFGMAGAAHAQSRNASTTIEVSSTGEATEAQVFTACSQASIETRDSSIGSARTAYNNAMALALDARKEAEKKAVAITDTGEKKAAIKLAVDDYKKAVAQAQDALTKARKEAWSSFEENTKACRDTSKDKRATSATVASSTETLRPDDEEKTFKDVIIHSFRALFKKGE